MPAAGGPGRAGPGSRGRAGPGGLGRGWGWGSGWGWGVWGEPWGLAGAGGAVTTGRYNKESPSLPGTSQGGAFASQKRKKQDTPHPTPDTRTHPGEPSESREGPALLQKLSRDVDPEQNRGAQDRARGLRGGRRTPRGCSARPLPRLRFRGAQERTLSSPCAHARRRLLASFRLGVWGGRSRVASRGFRGAGHSRFWVTGRPWDPPTFTQGGSTESWLGVQKRRGTCWHQRTDSIRGLHGGGGLPKGFRLGEPGVPTVGGAQIEGWRPALRLSKRGQTRPAVEGRTAGPGRHSASPPARRAPLPRAPRARRAGKAPGSAPGRAPPAGRPPPAPGQGPRSPACLGAAPAPRSSAPRSAPPPARPPHPRRSPRPRPRPPTPTLPGYFGLDP